MTRKYLFLGAFVTVTVGLLLWLAVNVGAIGGARGNHYTVRLDHAAGLVENNAIKIAGVQVGKIERVEVDHDIAVLHLNVDSDVKIHQDAVALVRAKSLLGEKYLQLEPGSREAPLLQNDSAIEDVRSTFEIDQVLNALEPVLGGEESIATVIGPLVERVDGLLGKAAGEDGGPAVVSREEIRETVEDVRASVKSVRRVAEANEEKVSELIDNLNKLLSDPKIPRIVANVDRMSREGADRLPEILDRMDSALTGLERVSGELTPERSAAIGKSIDDVTAATAELKKFTDDMGGLGQESKDLVHNLAIIAARAAGIDELTIRKFLQREGVLIKVSPPKGGVQGRIDALEGG